VYKFIPLWQPTYVYTNDCALSQNVTSNSHTVAMQT